MRSFKIGDSTSCTKGVTSLIQLKRPFCYYLRQERKVSLPSKLALNRWNEAERHTSLREQDILDISYGIPLPSIPQLPLLFRGVPQASVAVFANPDQILQVCRCPMQVNVIGVEKHPSKQRNRCRSVEPVYAGT
jgi:hypothetical protein